MNLDVRQELSQNFIEYATAVNSDRSIPDAKSGLKPVARRILFGSYNTGRISSKPYVKNARIVGDVMGSLHPHGDSSIYGALVRLSQPWVMRYPLIDFHGNQGSINGDGPAAMRYTEGRLAKISEDGMLNGLKKNCVDMMPTYDDSEKEPVTLPSIFPNLLCNPNSGIGVAMACSWACHNLREVETAILMYLNGEEPTLPGPDFPTGGIIINKNDIPAIMKTGRGSVKIRANYEIKKKEVIITEIPYGTTVEGLLDEIGQYADENPNLGIKDISDQTNNHGVKIVISCDNPESVIQKLFQKTKLQTSFAYNQVALVNKIPTELNLYDCCKIYVEHNIECIIREAKFDLTKAAARLHIVEGLLKALEDINNIIALIKNSKDSSAAKTALIEKYKFSEAQAKAILAMRLSSLAGLERVELQNEKTELEKTITDLNALVTSEILQKEELKKRLSEIVKKYGDNRKTQLMQIELPKTKEEKEVATVIPEKVVVTMMEDGTIKKIPASNFKTQRRNGKGIKSNGDIVSSVIRTNTQDSLMIFTNKGKMYRILVDNIPEGSNTKKGIYIKNLIEMDNNEEPTLIYSIYRDTDAKYILFTTKNGLVKKTPLEDYIKTKKKTGIVAINLKDNDELVSVSLISNENIILLTHGGMGIRISSNDISASGRTTAGVKGINLKKDDYVIAALPVRHMEDQLAIISETGLGKKINLTELPVQGRGGKGLIVYKVSDSTGCVICAALIANGDSVLITGTINNICIKAEDIPLLGRGSIGNQLIKGTKVTGISKV